MSMHIVTKQLCGKHEVIVPDGNGDKHFKELFCLLPSHSCQGRERKLQVETDDGK